MSKSINEENIFTWLLDGDVSIQYQANRDLLNVAKPKLRERIATEGWGAKFLSFRKAEGHWGRVFISPSGYRRIIHCSI